MCEGDMLRGMVVSGRPMLLQSESEVVFLSATHGAIDGEDDRGLIAFLL